MTDMADTELLDADTEMTPTPDLPITPKTAGRAKPRGAPKGTRKRRATDEVADPRVTKAKAIVTKTELHLWQATDCPFDTPFPASLLVVATSHEQAHKLALEASPVKGSKSLEERMGIHRVDLTRETVAFPGMGGPIVSTNRADSADAQAPAKLRVFMFEDFAWFDYVPAIAIVIAMNETVAHDLLGYELRKKNAPPCAGEDRTFYTELDLKKGLVVVLSTGNPPDPHGDNDDTMA